MKSITAYGFAIAVAIVLFQPAISGQVPQLSCGSEGEAPCVPTPVTAACDTGLRATPPTVCGCVLRGLFGNCLIPRLCVTCINSTRRRPSINAFTNSWADWALRNQRSLAEDEPLNWVMHLGTHNSFNTVSDGHLAFPNQFYSITDQLRSGARALSLDAYQILFEPRLCHSTGPDLAPAVCAAPGNLNYPSLPGYRFYANGIKEIRNWMRLNPNEIVVNDLEDWVHETGGEPSHVLEPLFAYLGPWIYRAGADGAPPDGRWPTRRELLAAGRRVIVFDNDGDRTGGGVFQEGAAFGGFGDTWFAKNFMPYPHCDRYPFSANAAANSFTVDDEAARFADGDRVALKPIPLAGPLPTGVSELTSYHVVNSSRAGNATTFQLATTSGGAPIDLTSTDCDSAPPLTKAWDAACGMLGKRPLPSWSRFSLLVEERQLALSLLGPLDEQGIVNATACNQSMILLDRFSHVLAPVPSPPNIDVTDFGRQAAAVWSWRENDRGQNGDCARLNGANARWSSASCEEVHRFACARPRAESGIDPLEWQDPLGEDWRITTAAARWEEGHAICQSEFPGYVFGVPVNGFQNRRLHDENGGESNLWLNYNDRDVEGRWVISRPPVVNAPPVAVAGADQDVTCKAPVRLDGLGSTDRDGDPLTYTWTGPFGTLSGPVVAPALPLGEHAILLTVTDGRGGVDTDSVTVTVTDNKAPWLTVSLTPKVLMTANKELVPITAMIQAADRCDDEPPAVELVSISLYDASLYAADATTTPDVADAEPGTDDREFQVRATAIDKRNGRLYQAIYRATDQAGNVTTAKGNVFVPYQEVKPATQD